MNCCSRCEGWCAQSLLQDGQNILILTHQVSLDSKAKIGLTPIDVNCPFSRFDEPGHFGRKFLFKGDIRGHIFAVKDGVDVDRFCRPIKTVHFDVQTSHSRVSPKRAEQSVDFPVS